MYIIFLYIFKINQKIQRQNFLPTPQKRAHSNLPRLLYVTLSVPQTGLYSFVLGHVFMQSFTVDDKELVFIDGLVA